VNPAKRVQGEGQVAQAPRPPVLPWAWSCRPHHRPPPIPAAGRAARQIRFELHLKIPPPCDIVLVSGRASARAHGGVRSRDEAGFSPRLPETRFSINPACFAPSQAAIRMPNAEQTARCRNRSMNGCPCCAMWRRADRHVSSAGIKGDVFAPAYAFHGGTINVRWCRYWLC